MKKVLVLIGIIIFIGVLILLFNVKAFEVIDSNFEEKMYTETDEVIGSLISTETITIGLEKVAEDYTIENNISIQEAYEELSLNGNDVYLTTQYFSLGDGDTVGVAVKYVIGESKQIEKVISVATGASSDNTWYELEVYDYNEGKYPRSDLNIDVFGYSETVSNNNKSSSFNYLCFLFQKNLVHLCIIESQLS